MAEPLQHEEKRNSDPQITTHPSNDGLRSQMISRGRYKSYRARNQIDCRYYHKSTGCRYGVQCHYKHCISPMSAVGKLHTAIKIISDKMDAEPQNGNERKWRKVYDDNGNHICTERVKRMKPEKYEKISVDKLRNMEKRMDNIEDIVADLRNYIKNDLTQIIQRKGDDKLKRMGDLNKHTAEIKKEIKKMKNDLNNMAKEQQNLHKLSEKLETLDLKQMMTNLNKNIGEKHKELLKNIKSVNSTMNSLENNHPNLESEIVDRIDLLESILRDHMDSNHKTLLDIMTQENELKTQTIQTDKLDDDNAYKPKLSLSDVIIIEIDIQQSEANNIGNEAKITTKASMDISQHTETSLSNAMMDISNTESNDGYTQTQTLQIDKLVDDLEHLNQPNDDDNDYLSTENDGSNSESDLSAENDMESDLSAENDGSNMESLQQNSIDYEDTIEVGNQKLETIVGINFVYYTTQKEAYTQCNDIDNCDAVFRIIYALKELSKSTEKQLIRKLKENGNCDRLGSDYMHIKRFHPFSLIRLKVFNGVNEYCKARECVSYERYPQIRWRPLIDKNKGYCIDVMDLLHCHILHKWNLDDEEQNN